MAIYHLSVQTISRGQGKSCVAAAAYRAGEKLHDERQGLNHDYTKKHDVESEIIAPSNVPSWVTDREKLWNEVDRAETRCNSRTAREINIALPLELSKEQQKELVREYVKESFVSKGMVADVCFHFNDENNPHCHVMLTTREMDQEGFTKKNRQWDKKERVEEWREQWANHSNKALEKADCQERIDHRSYKDQGIDQVPTIHLGKTSSEMKKKGLDNPRVEINNQINKLNKEKVIALQEYRELKSKLEQEKAKESQRYSNLTEKEKSIVISAEKIVGEPLNYSNLSSKLTILDQERNDIALKHSEMRFKPLEIERYINTVNDYKNELRALQSELRHLPKGFFGGYKDKNRALEIERGIEKCNEALKNNGYKSSFSIQKKEQELKETKTLIKEYENKLQDLNYKINTLSQGQKALQKKELREFIQSYKDIFPQAKYMDYRGMKAVKELNSKLDKPATPKQILSTFKKYEEKLSVIDKELDSIQDNGRRLINSREALDTIDKTKDIAEKYDTKVFGREKYQREHQHEKWQHDNAIQDLKKYGVKSKVDLRQQERIQENNIKNIKPKLEADKLELTPKINLLSNALQALSDAFRAEKQQQRQEELKLTKAFKCRDMEDELDYGR